eukprot:evm.model.NODE_29330_length_32469_cov_23.021097.4
MEGGLVVELEKGEEEAGVDEGAEEGEEDEEEEKEENEEEKEEEEGTRCVCGSRSIAAYFVLKAREVEEAAAA